MEKKEEKEKKNEEDEEKNKKQKLNVKRPKITWPREVEIMRRAVTIQLFEKMSVLETHPPRSKAVETDDISTIHR